MINQQCNPWLKSIGSCIRKFFGCSPQNVFYVVYPPLDQAEEIRAHPERFKIDDWPREKDVYDWFHEAHLVADAANDKAGLIVAIVCEKVK